MSLANLKKNSNAALDKLKTQMETKSGYQNDETYWRPTFDKEAASGSAVVRFLPAIEGEDMPWSKLIRHNFKGPNGKYYNENSLRTIGQEDPVGNLNGRLWNSGIESDKDVAKAQKQKIEYTTNVYIVKDPANPENDGKVFKYKFGPMIFEKINSAMFPKFETDEALDPFNPWHGADFNIRIIGKKVGKDLVPNYETSSFSVPKPMFKGDDDQIEAVYAKAYPLKPITDPSLFKTRAELEKRLLEVLGASVGSGVPVVEGYSAPQGQSAAPQQKTAEPAQRQETSAHAPSEKPKVEDEDDDAAFLRSLMDS